MAGEDARLVRRRAAELEAILQHGAAVEGDERLAGDDHAASAEHAGVAGATRRGRGIAPRDGPRWREVREPVAAHEPLVAGEEMRSPFAQESPALDVRRRARARIEVGQIRPELDPQPIAGRERDVVRIDAEAQLRPGGRDLPHPCLVALVDPFQEPRAEHLHGAVGLAPRRLPRGDLRHRRILDARAGRERLLRRLHGAALVMLLDGRAHFRDERGRAGARTGSGRGRGARRARGRPRRRRRGATAGAEREDERGREGGAGRHFGREVSTPRSRSSPSAARACRSSRWSCRGGSPRRRSPSSPCGGCRSRRASRPGRRRRGCGAARAPRSR